MIHSQQRHFHSSEMAAYAALLSLQQIIDQILHPPPSHQFILDEAQINSLRSKVCSLIDLLENYSSKEIEDLESQIAYAAYEAEDVIESNVVDQILGRSELDREEGSPLSQGLQRVVGKFLSIDKELAKIKHKKALQPKISASDQAASSRPLPSSNDTVVGLEYHMNEIMSSLSSDESNSQIVSIVGMGGIGKTTLARNVYNKPYIMSHFHVRAWITVSQVYDKIELLLGIWRQIGNKQLNEDEINRSDRIGELIHKELLGRKYLIVMDDMWDIQAWEEVRWCLPPNDNGSRILVTTRLSNMAAGFRSCIPHEMKFLDEKQSWDLLREKVFAKEVPCPIALEEVGKIIAKRCGGLPLALVVIGGLLAKSNRTREHWEYVKENVSFAVNHENDEHCMKILSLSYSHLPIYLKPCFLYLAVFPEDLEIKVSMLIRLWVAEGFVKPIMGKSLEEAAKEYLVDLIDRNLILVRRRGSSGKVKSCSIHDLLRDLCTREAQKGEFFHIPKPRDTNISLSINRERRLIIDGGLWRNKGFEVSRLAALVSRCFTGPQPDSALIRSFLSYSSSNSHSDIAPRLRLLRVFHMVDRRFGDKKLPLVNLRYVACTASSDLVSSSIFQFWNLQTLVVDAELALPAEFWQMPQLRHIKMQRISLCDPPPDNQNTRVLENLQTLSTVRHFKCSEQVINSIPNLMKLGIAYGANEIVGSFCLSNLVGLRKLESLVINSKMAGICGSIAFPSSLKKLVLSRCEIPWEDMSIVGLLPNLEVLKLQYQAAKGQKWNPVEGEFSRLKFLLIDDCELEIWQADNTHFPSLERLVLGYVSLKGIPIGFAEILNFQVIVLRRSSSLWTSAEEISKERESLGYEGLQIRSYYPLRVRN